VTAADGMVIDASVVLRWLLESDPDPHASQAMEALDERFALVPVLWHFEVANGLRNAVRAGIHPPETITAFADRLELLDIRTDSVTPHLRRLGNEAVISGLTAYDVSYLLLARDRGLPLATFDAELAATARSTGVDLAFDVN